MSATTDENGQASTTLTQVPQGGFAVIEATITNRCNLSFQQRCQVDFLQSAPDDWPMFMRDARHQGFSRTSDTAAITAFGNPVWTQPIDTATTDRGPWAVNVHPNPALGSTFIFEHPYIDSSPVHASGSPVIVGAWVGGSGSYLNGSKGYVTAFNPTTGAVQWDYPAGARNNDNLRLLGGISSTPAIATVNGQQLVFFGCMDGKVYCLNAATGTLLWSFQTWKRDDTTAARIIQSPVVHNGVVYIGNESARVYALNATDGTPVWASPFEIQEAEIEAGTADMTGVTSIAVANIAGQVCLYFGSDYGYLYSVDANTSSQIWAYRPESSGCIESSPTVYAGNIYFGITRHRAVNLFALNATTGEPVWTTRLTPPEFPTLGDEIRATCAAMDNAIFIGEDTGHYFFRVNAQTGEVDPDNTPTNPFDAVGLFGIGTEYFVGSAALTSAGYALVGNDNGHLYALSDIDLYQLSSYDTSLGNSPGNNSYICSSPSLTYSAQVGYKWIYVVSRADNGRQDGRGTLFAFRQLAD